MCLLLGSMKVEVDGVTHECVWKTLSMERLRARVRMDPGLRRDDDFMVILLSEHRNVRRGDGFMVILFREYCSLQRDDGFMAILLSEHRSVRRGDGFMVIRSREYRILQRDDGLLVIPLHEPSRLRMTLFAKRLAPNSSSRRRPGSSVFTRI